MSADEIRRLAEIPAQRAGSTYTPSECADVVVALLAFAAMVERCEKIRADIMARTFKHDIGWMGGNDKVIYTSIGEILQTMKGATDERK